MSMNDILGMINVDDILKIQLQLSDENKINQKRFNHPFNLWIKQIYRKNVFCFTYILCFGAFLDRKKVAVRWILEGFFMLCQCLFGHGWKIFCLKSKGPS